MGRSYEEGRSIETQLGQKQKQRVCFKEAGKESLFQGPLMANAIKFQRK